MIPVTRDLVLDEDEIRLVFVRTAGPGGQNVNKVATGVQLRFDVRNSPSLPEDVRTRLLRLANNRITADGILIINARRFRTQGRNRQDAIDRLVDLIRKAILKPKVRRKTKPSRAAHERRLRAKRRRSITKSLRSAPPDLGD